MSGYDLYILSLCVLVFVLLTTLFSVMLHYILKMTIKAIRYGLEDGRITTEYRKMKNPNLFLKICGRIISTILFVSVMAVFAFSVYIQVSGNKIGENVAVPKIVLSSSMSFKHEKNTYLEQNNINDQFDTFDLIFVEKLPGEFELELYDIVVYEYHGESIIHRIVGIEEPNAEHPDARHFLLQGDAVQYADDYPVLYEQMKAIYRGTRVKYVGSFFAFMQSPAGYLCMLLIIFGVFATPIAEKKLWREKVARLRKIGVIQPGEKVKGVPNDHVKTTEEQTDET